MTKCCRASLMLYRTCGIVQISISALLHYITLDKIIEYYNVRKGSIPETRLACTLAQVTHRPSCQPIRCQLETMKIPVVAWQIVDMKLAHVLEQFAHGIAIFKSKAKL